MEKRIKGRLHTLCQCFVCGKDKWKCTAYLKDHKKTFCSAECLSRHKRIGKTIICLNCKKETYRSRAELKRSKSGDHFCSKHCATVINNTRYKRKENHPNWNGGRSLYRSLALAHYGTKCMNPACELTHTKIDVPLIMMDVHHIDKNRKNNATENLTVLCVWCHTKITRERWQ